MVGYLSDVEEIYFGENGIFWYVKEGVFVIDMMILKLFLVKKIVEKVKEKLIYVLDVFVFGGDIGVWNGMFVIMVGGEKEVFEVCLLFFFVMGENI